MLSNLNETLNATNPTKALNLGLVTDYLDYVTRIVALLIHVVYMLFIVYFKEFQTRSMLFLHHVNVISMIYCIHYVFYIGNQTASFSNNDANAVLCYASEVIWINLKFLRLYSLLLLAVYRYTAVFKIQFHRKFNSSLSYMWMAIVAIWLLSIVMSFSLKYIFNTSYSRYFCYEGYSGYWLNSVLFFMFLIGTSYIIPTVTVVVLYTKIIDKLKQLSINLTKKKPIAAPLESNSRYAKVLAKIKKTNKATAAPPAPTIFSVDQQSPTNSDAAVNRNQTGNTFKIRENKNPKQKRFAQQMILMVLLTCIGSVFSILSNVQVTLSTNPYFNSLNGLLENVSPVFRIIFLAFQSSIPFISIVYSPWSYSWREFKNKITMSELITSVKSRS